MKTRTIAMGVLAVSLLTFDRPSTAVNSPKFSKNDHNLPERSNQFMSGREFLERTKHLNAEAREAAILREIKKGNIPSFLRKLEPVYLSIQGRDGRAHRGVIWVMPDYISIGSDKDYVRIPMNPLTASALAEEFDFILPTTKLVDDIYKNSMRRLNPITMPPTVAMSSNRYYASHNFSIEQQLEKAVPTTLLAGHKKDVVLSKRLEKMPGRVAIYGWHRLNGKPIQPLSLVHDHAYADYSHGIRFIRNVMLVDGKTMLISDVLKHPVLSALVSNEGTLAHVGY